MSQRTNWFRACMECESTVPNHSGICPSCELHHGYANDNRAPVFADDVDPPARDPKEDL